MDLPAFLAIHGINPGCHVHPPVMTVAESERLVPPLPGAKTKNLFLRDRKGARHRTLWGAPALQAHPLRNDATMVIAHADLRRFLAATGHVARVLDVPSAASSR